jgi:hypothetical protein
MVYFNASNPSAPGTGDVLYEELEARKRKATMEGV